MENIIRGYNFEEIQNEPILENNKRMIELGERLNASYEDYIVEQLTEVMEKTLFIIPVRYDGDIHDIDTAIEEGISLMMQDFHSDQYGNGELLSLFTCYGEMIKTLTKRKVISDYNKLIMVDIYVVNAFIDRLNLDGFVLDSDGIQLFNFK